MYFDFEDYHPSIEPVGRALTKLEMVLLTIIFHLLMVIVILLSPKWLPQYLPKWLQTVPFLGPLRAAVSPFTAVEPEYPCHNTVNGIPFTA